MCNYNGNIEWDTTKYSGDPVRVLNIERAERLLDYKQITDIRTGIEKTIEWYIYNNKIKH